MENIYLGIDIGTTNVKLAAINGKGEILGFFSKQVPLITLRENWVEQDPQEWWKATIDCFQQMSNSGLFDLNRVESIGVSGQGTGATFVGRHGEVLRNCLIWMDRRSEIYSSQFADFRDRVFALSGNELDAVYNTLAAIWVKDNEPEIFRKSYKMLTATEFIVFKLSGKFASNRSDAGNQMSYDMEKEGWSEEIMEHLGLSVDLLPPIFECTDIVGSISNQAAKDLGLRSGIKIIAGGEDTSSATFAMGVYKDGQSHYSTGTSTNLGICITDKFTPNQGVPNVLTLPHVVKNMRLISGNITTSGSCTAWLKSTHYNGEAQPFAKMDEEVMQAAPGAGNLFFLPYLAGTFSPDSNTNARGTFVGISLATGRGEIARAVMEGVAFEVRNHFTHLANHGYTISEMRGAGGPTKSEIWNQITADISGVKLTLIESLADASVGDAMLAAIAVGGFSSFEDAVNKTVKLGKTYEPQSETANFYKKRFEINRLIFNSLHPTFDQIATLD
jgi:xylulokinase